MTLTYSCAAGVKAAPHPAKDLHDGASNHREIPAPAAPLICESCGCPMDPFTGECRCSA